MPEAYRTERDSMGEVRVPADAKWGAQTHRAVENFPISGMRKERSLIQALALIKGAAATVNGRQKTIEKDVAKAIAEAAAEVAEGKWDEHFPIDVFQTGSSTASNGSRQYCRVWPNSLWEARPPAPASTRPRVSPAPSSSCWPTSSSSRSPRRATTSRPRARATHWSRRRACCA